jgi:hypothetical protein
MLRQDAEADWESEIRARVSLARRSCSSRSARGRYGPPRRTRPTRGPAPTLAIIGRRVGFRLFVSEVPPAPERSRSPSEVLPPRRRPPAPATSSSTCAFPYHPVRISGACARARRRGASMTCASRGSCGRPSTVARSTCVRIVKRRASKNRRYSFHERRRTRRQQEKPERARLARAFGFGATVR